MNRDGPFPYAPTIRVEGGIKAKSVRGPIGTSWWSQRFLAVLESLAMGGRMLRGRNYARAGQVLSLEVGPGKVTAVVQGSRPKPYAVTIGLKVLADGVWEDVERALAEQALFGARLLSGQMPEQIEEVFAAVGSPLFPSRAADLAMACSCPDWGEPCKHVAAALYLLAEAFDADPFQILHWRGRDRATLLAHLRELRDAGSAPAAKRPRKTARRKAAEERAAATSPIDPVPVLGASLALDDIHTAPLADSVDRFWVAPVPLPARPATLDTEADLILRQLSTPPAEAGGAALVASLRDLYRLLGASEDD